MKSKINNASGFTLIEVLIAALIITGGMVTMASFLGSLVEKNAGNERKTMATVIAEEQIEGYRVMALQGDLTAAMGYPTVTDQSYDANGTSSGDAGYQGPFYTLRGTINDTNNPHTVTVQVSWTGRGNTQVSLSSMIND